MTQTLILEGPESSVVLPFLGGVCEGAVVFPLTLTVGHGSSKFRGNPLGSRRSFLPPVCTSNSVSLWELGSITAASGVSPFLSVGSVA